jgi:hypothetical protein
MLVEGKPHAKLGASSGGTSASVRSETGGLGTMSNPEREPHATAIETATRPVTTVASLMP